MKPYKHNPEDKLPMDVIARQAQKEADIKRKFKLVKGESGTTYNAIVPPKNENELEAIKRRTMGTGRYPTVENGTISYTPNENQLSPYPISRGKYSATPKKKK